MRKKILQLCGILGLSFFMIFTLDLSNNDGKFLGDLFVPAIAQEEGEAPECDPPSEQCGPLMGNSAGTRYCCANTNTDCCYASACG